MLKKTNIEGVYLARLSTFQDTRGSLTELWRTDWLEPIGGPVPVMCYVSVTHPEVSRGPHEHRYQTDYFAFIGPGDFRLKLWDARSDSPTKGAHLSETFGVSNPMAVIIPPGVIHGYRCVSDADGVVLNFVDKLYAGKNKQEPVDEIRHEESDNSLYKMT
jgi:dTDP-4-dehydrorhamnose 3,5-epimerase-like enzyme